MRAYLSKTWFVAIVAALIGLGASADVVTNSEPFTISEPTVWAGVTNIYTYTTGFSKINANLELKDHSYVRIVGTNTIPAKDFGVRIADQSANDLAITINSRSALYGTYRYSTSPASWVAAGIDYGTLAAPSYVKFFLGAATGGKDSAGRATIVVNSRGIDFGSNAASMGFWAEYFYIEPTVKPHASGYIDFLQLNTAYGVADITYIENRNTYYPARILFQGGYLRNNYVNNHGNNQLSPATNTVIALEGIGGYNVRIQKSYNGNRRLNGGMGTVRFQGDCEVQLEEAGAYLPGTSGANRTPLYLDPAMGPIEWRQKKDLCVIGYGIIAIGDPKQTKTSFDPNEAAVLPYRADEPGVRLRNNAILDIEGHTVKLRSLVSESSSAMVTNVIASYNGRAVTSTIVFGSENTDGIFAAKCCDNVNVEKVGSGLLVVSNVTMVGTLTIKEGRVMFTGKNTFSRNVVIEDGVEVVETVVPSTDTIKVLDNNIPKHTGEFKVRYEQTATNDVYMYGGEFTEGVTFDIRKGKLMFTGAVKDEYWKLTVKTAMAAKDGTIDASYCEINSLGLWPSNFTRATLKTDLRTSLAYGITTNKNWTAPSALVQGKCTEEPNGIKWTTGTDGRTWSGPDAIFDNGAASCWQVTKTETGTAMIPKLEVTSSWYSVAFRMPANSQPVSSFSTCRDHWGDGIGAWILASSPNGRDGSWVVRHEHLVQWADTKGMTMAEADRVSEYPHCDDKSPTGASQKESQKWYNDGVPYRFNNGGSASESLQDIRAIVADGATLDTLYIGDQYLSFAALDLDLANGGGTITKFSPRAGGALYLTNLPAGKTLRDLRELPIEIGAFVNSGNLASWSIYLDGVQQKGVALVITEGKLCLKHSYGIYLNFR